MTFLSAFAPALVQAGGSVLGGLFGASAESEAAKAAKKAAKLQAQSAANQLKFAKDVYGGATTTSGEVVPQQQNFLRTATGEALGYQEPYLGAGTGVANTLAGLSGADPTAAAATIEAFKRSPIYQLNYQAMLDEANKAVNAGAAAGGSFNSGARLAALTKLPASILGQLFPEYVRGLTGQQAVGQQAAGTATNLAAGLGTGQANVLGSYAQRAIDLARGVTGAAESPYAAQRGAYGNIGTANVGAITGPASQFIGGISGAATPIANALTQYFQPQPAGPTNIIPRGY